MRPLAISFFIAAVVLIVLSELQFLYLKKNFPDEWERLGKPDVFFNNNADNTIKSLRYVWSGRHKDQARTASLYVYLVRVVWCLAVVLLGLLTFGPR